MKIKPLGDRVLVKVDEVKESKGGVILPDSVQANELVYATVMATGNFGPDCIDAADVVIGAKVSFVRYSAAEIKDGNDKYLVLRLSDVIAVLE